jgi:hypothetical protein
MDSPDVLETSSKDDLEKLAESKHCFFCSKLWKNMLNFYSHLPYDLVNDAKKRQEYSKEGALCRFHLWQLASMASSACLSLVLAEITQGTSRRLSAWMGNGLKSGNIFGMLINSNSICLVCSYARQIEMQYMDYFRKLLAKREGLAAYEKSKGFCLRHAVLIIDGLNEEFSKFIIMHSAKQFSELSQNLLGFSQKTSVRRKDLIQPDERYAVSRALIQVGGTKYLQYLLME